MGEQNTSGLKLFDLLAREWVLQEAVVQVEFNHEDTTVLFRLASGAFALAALKDNESPKIRTRMELETGRTTIKPRENPVTPVISPQLTLDRDLPVARFGSQGFAGLDAQGSIVQITAGGQTVAKGKPGDTVTSICSSPSGHLLSIAQGTKLTLHTVPDMEILAEIALDHPVTCQSVSADSTKLAAWGKGTLSLINLQDASGVICHIRCDGPVTDIVWNETSVHIACASSNQSFHIVDLASQHAQRIEGYPAPVRSLAFSETGNALITSGAYRLAGWSITDLPHDDLPGTPLTTGKPGLVVIDTIAAHPCLDLVATGYANGLAAISRVGKPEEMILHHEAGTSISALCWSKTGEHLAMGFASGKAAIVTFPTQLFK